MEVTVEALDFTHNTAKYLVPSLDAADVEEVAAGVAAELADEAATAWTGRSLATTVGAAEVGVVSDPDSPRGTHAAEAEDKARARARICL